MTAPRYQILFSGEPLPGIPVETLKDNLCRLFKIERDRIEQLFSGQAKSLKRGLAATEAERYLQALQKAGAKVYRLEEPLPAQGPSAKETSPLAIAKSPTAPEDIRPKLQPADTPKSPYAPPLAALAASGPKEGKLRLFTSTGRIGRLRYLAWQLVLVLLILPIIFLSLKSAAQSPIISLSILAASSLTLAVTSIQINIQRLHDMDRSGWTLLLSLIPVIGSLLPLFLALIPGTPETNRFGPPPPPNSFAVKLIAPVWLILLLVGVFTNVYQTLTLLTVLSRSAGL